VVWVGRLVIPPFLPGVALGKVPAAHRRPMGRARFAWQYGRGPSPISPAIRRWKSSGSLRLARPIRPNLKEIARSRRSGNRVDALRSSRGMASRFRRPQERLGIHFGRSLRFLELRRSGGGQPHEWRESTELNRFNLTWAQTYKLTQLAVSDWGSLSWRGPPSAAAAAIVHPIPSQFAHYAAFVPVYRGRRRP